MSKSFVIKGNICQTKDPRELDVHEGAFAVSVDGISAGIFHPCPKNTQVFLFMTMATH